MGTNWLRNTGLLTAVTALGTLTGCQGGHSSLPPPPGVVNRVSLQSFQGANACADLEQYLEDTAVTQMRSSLEASRDGVPYWGWLGGFRGGLEAATLAGAAPPTDKSSGPTSYTTTNNQEAGVDEADFVKNDGTRIFVLSGNTLHAVKSWPAADTALQSTLTIEGYPQELFLEGTTRAVVFSSVYNQYPLSDSNGATCRGLACGYWYSNTVKVTEVDVTDLTNLRVLKETYLPGSYRSARKVGSSVRLVITDGFNFPPGFKYSPDWEEGLWNDKARLRAAYDRVIAENEALIRRQTLAEWVPAVRVKRGGAETVLPTSCTSYARVNAPTELGQFSVVTLDLGSDTVHRSSLLAAAGEVYATAQNLYVATSHWWWWPQPGQTDTTYLHKFDISQPTEAVYVASGAVSGSIVDQFSLDEGPTGHLRVVTNLNRRVVDLTQPDAWWGRIETSNQLTVLGENAGSLQVVGKSRELAPGERVMSSRMIGDKGFVVTFRQIDPLFTFDLSDPTNPRVLGELKVPGFSTYLHPLDANHLLTIGTYVPEPVNGQAQDWRARALQLAIFDVTDMANPVQTHTQLVGTSYGWSEAAYEHKAFNYFAEKKLLAIPFADWSNDTNANWSSFTSDLRLFSVDPVLGFTSKGALSMSDLYQSYTYGQWTYYWTPSVRRSVLADDFVYAISDSGLRVATVDALDAPLATTRFVRYVEP